MKFPRETEVYTAHRCVGQWVFNRSSESSFMKFVCPTLAAFLFLRLGWDSDAYSLSALSRAGMWSASNSCPHRVQNWSVARTVRKHVPQLAVS